MFKHGMTETKQLNSSISQYLFCKLNTNVKHFSNMLKLLTSTIGTLTVTENQWMVVPEVILSSSWQRKLETKNFFNLPW